MQTKGKAEKAAKNVCILGCLEPHTAIRPGWRALHFHTASFFRFMATNLSFTQFVTWAMSLITIYNKNKKRRGRSKYLLSVMVEVVKDEKIIPAKVVYVRNRNKRKEYLCLISTDTSLSEDEIIRIYGKRWDTEVFFKVCKSYLNLSKECNSLSYDAITAHTAVVFTRYMMLSLESRESNDSRSLGEIFLYFTDEMSDITWIQVFQMLLQMFQNILVDELELSEEKLDELVDAFMNAIPTV